MRRSRGGGTDEERPLLVNARGRRPVFAEPRSGPVAVVERGRCAGVAFPRAGPNAHPHLRCRADANAVYPSGSAWLGGEPLELVRERRSTAPRRERLIAS